MDVRGLAVFVVFLFLGACAPKLKGDQVNQIFAPPDQSPKCLPTVISNRFIVRWKDQHVSVETALNRDVFIETFLKPHLREIDFVENDYRVQSVEPVQTQATTPSPDWATTMVKVSSAWTRNITGTGVVVGLVDTGADVTDLQLAGRIEVNQVEFKGKPGVDDDGNGYIDDIYGWNFVANKPLTGDNADHGTHVSGIILADSAKGPIHGMAPTATLIPTAFLDATGSGTTGDAVRAMQYAIQRGAKMINASWGGTACSNTLRDLVASMGDRGILFVVAAGNDGVNIDQAPTYPASFAALDFLAQITVGASTYLDEQAYFSNEGVKSVHLVAPGMSITSTIPGNKTATYSGTSMATPFVTGAAALLWSDRPKATLTDIKNAILNGVDQGEFLVRTTGRLNLEKSLTYLESHVTQ